MRVGGFKGPWPLCGAGTSRLHIIFEKAEGLNLRPNKKPSARLGSWFGAGWGTQTPGLFLGKEALYQLS